MMMMMTMMMMMMMMMAMLVNDVTGWSFPLFHSTNIHNHETFPAPNDEDVDDYDVNVRSKL